uniref:Mitochondrial import inner membrane translocase subunit n=1 Tax=Moschus moschiferus TaxID=68415 RepID=A0A8C6DNX6_MOSMO
MEGGFGSDFGGSGGGKLDPGLIMVQVKVQIAVANAQELLQRMTDKCFRKCIWKPGGSLDNLEQKCIAMCMDPRVVAGLRMAFVPFLLLCVST